MRFVYEYEDHSYKTQKEAYSLLRSVSDVRICAPGNHDWRKQNSDGLGPEVCNLCHLMKLLRSPPHRRIM